MSLIKACLVGTSLFVTCLITSCGSEAGGQRETASGTPGTIAPPIATPTATPTPTPRPTTHPAALNALKSLRKMASATEMGINFQEYSSRMIDLKAEVDESLGQLPNGEVKKEINLALQAYVDGKTLWSDSATSDWVITMLEPGHSLQRKYKIPEVNEGTAASKNVALSTIWAAANRHIDRATKLLDE